MAPVIVPSADHAMAWDVGLTGKLTQLLCVKLHWNTVADPCNKTGFWLEIKRRRKPSQLAKRSLESHHKDPWLIQITTTLSTCMKRVILAQCAADYGESPVSCWMTQRVFACERIVVNPSALTVDCPQLRVNEVRIECRWAPDKQKQSRETQRISDSDWAHWLKIKTNQNNLVMK